MPFQSPPVSPPLLGPGFAIIGTLFQLGLHEAERRARPQVITMSGPCFLLRSK